MFALMKNKNFTLLFAGTFVSNIGTTFYNFAVGWFILSLTESPFQAGLYIAVGAILQLVTTPLAGVFIDRLHKVKILVVTDFVRGIAVVIGGILIFVLKQDLYILIILYSVTAILAINGAFFSPSVMAITPEIVEDKDLNQANAFFSLIRSFQAIIGVLLAGIFYALVGIEMIFIFNGISFILSAISEMFIRLEKKVAVTAKTRQFRIDFKEGITYILNKNGFLSFLVIILFLNFAISPFFANVLPVFFNLEMQKEPIHLSGVQVAFSIGALIGGILMATVGRTLSVKRTIKRGITGTLITLGVLGILMHFMLLERLEYVMFYIVFLAVCLLMAIVNMFVNIPLQTALMRMIDEHVRGRVMSILDMLTQGLIPLAIVLAGTLLELFSVSFVLVVLFLFMVIPYVLLMLSQRVNILLEEI